MGKSASTPVVGGKRVAAKSVAPYDGRKRRSHASQQRIVAAYLALVKNGNMTPSAEQVSAVAAVGLRSVFRHFSDMEALYEAAAAIIALRLEAVAAQPFKTAVWPGRIFEMIERRSEVYEALGPFLRAEQVHRARSPVLQAAQTTFVAVQRQILLDHMPKQPAHSNEAIDAIDLLLSFEAWQRLRAEQRLTVSQARSVLRAALGAIVVPAPARLR